MVMDFGNSINPGIDHGQATGGFIQGMGWVTTEELKYSGSGELLSHSPTTYKIPNIQDTPDVFELEFIKNEKFRLNVARSKASGEPPLLLGIAVWTAVKNALSYLPNVDPNQLRLPATGEEILKTMTNTFGKNHKQRQTNGRQTVGKKNGSGGGLRPKKRTVSANKKTR